MLSIKKRLPQQALSYPITSNHIKKHHEDLRCMVKGFFLLGLPVQTLHEERSPSEDKDRPFPIYVTSLQLINDTIY